MSIDTKIIKKLQENELFSDLTESELQRIFTRLKFSMKHYDKNAVIAIEEEECKNLGLIIDGIIEIQRLYSSGKHIVLNRFNNGGVFGEAIMFGKFRKYPATVVAVEKCTIMYIDRNELIKMCLEEQIILENFIKLLSDKIFILNKKIKNISFKTVREKVVNFILEESITQKSNVIKLKTSKEEIASVIGIPRPSLSRELIKLREEKLIEFDRSTIKICEIELLEDELVD